MVHQLAADEPTEAAVLSDRPQGRSALVFLVGLGVAAFLTAAATIALLLGEGLAGGANATIRGLLIASLHNAGLATLTHTPSPMGFLNAICGRPESEKALILLVAGYPAEDAQVPDITRKQADEVIVWRE